MCVLCVLSVAHEALQLPMAFLSSFSHFCMSISCLSGLSHTRINIFLFRRHLKNKVEVPEGQVRQGGGQGGRNRAQRLWNLGRLQAKVYFGSLRFLTVSVRKPLFRESTLFIFLIRIQLHGPFCQLCKSEATGTSKSQSSTQTGGKIACNVLRCLLVIMLLGL